MARGDAKTVVSDGVGNFRVPLSSPGRYNVTVEASGFKTSKLETTVSQGVITPLAVRLEIGEYGPNYTDFDIDASKGFRMPGPENAKLRVGVQLFNAFNHANFQIPVSDVNSSANGIIYTTANTPTSILGAFLGGDASPRLIQLKGTFVF